MAYELLFGKGKIQGMSNVDVWMCRYVAILTYCSHPLINPSGGGMVKRRLLEHEDKLRCSLSDQMTRKGVSSHEKLLSRNIQLASSLPKYIRINEIAKPIPAAYEVLLYLK